MYEVAAIFVIRPRCNEQTVVLLTDVLRLALIGKADFKKMHLDFVSGPGEAADYPLGSEFYINSNLLSIWKIAVNVLHKMHSGRFRTSTC